MKKQYKLGIIGCGFMATSILRGVVLSDFLSERKIIVSDISEEKLDKIDYLGVRTTTDNAYVAENSEYLVFAVKYQDFENVVKSLNGYRPEKVISVMEGVCKSVLKNELGVGLIKVARCVPNLPCSIGSGIIGIDMTDFNKSNDDTDFISNIFNNLGTIVSVEEDKMDAVAGIGTAGPAYAFMLLDGMIDAAVKQGLNKDEAKIIAVQTILGAAEMVKLEDGQISDLLMQACGKGSPTLEAVKVFADNNFGETVAQAVNEVVNRYKELSGK